MMQDLNGDGPETSSCGEELPEEELDDEETASLRPLFPDGDPSKEGEWQELFPEPPVLNE